MSVVIAKKTKEGFVVGADSMCTRGGQVREEAIKIFRCQQNEDIIIGVVGCLRDANILMAAEDLFNNSSLRRDALDFNSMVTQTIPNLKELLKTDGRLLKSQEGDCMASNILIAYKNKCYVIGGDFSLTQVDDFYAIGAPELMADGCYEMIRLCKTDITDEKLVENIIRTTIKKTIYVDYPIRIFKTYDKNDMVIEK